MGIVFSENFETGITTMTPTVSTGCSVEITTTNPINGVYSVNCYILSQPMWTYAYLSKSIGSIQKAYIETKVRLDSFVGGSLRGFIAILGSGRIIAYLGLNVNRELVLTYLSSGAYPAIASSKTLELGVPYKINLEVDVGTNSAIRVFVDDIEVADLAAIGVDNSDAVAIYGAEVGIRGGQDLEALLTIDDFTISDTSVPTDYHQLSVDSTPITNIPFTLIDSPQSTPFTQTLEEGFYTISMPPQIDVDGQIYNFVSWEDASTNPTRTINLVSDISLIATYELIQVPSHTLTVNSTPIEGVQFTVEKVI